MHLLVLGPPVFTALPVSLLLYVLLTTLLVCAVCHAGTGKTVYVKKQLQDGLPSNMTSMFLNFSAQTSANMTQVGWD